MRALVTGGAGFIGSHLVDALVARGDSVVAVDDLSAGREENLGEALSAGAELRVADVTDGAAIAEVAREAEPDAVFHLAAQVDVRRAVRDPAFDATVNVAGTTSVLEASRAAGAARVVFASTGGAIYGEGEGRLPLTEEGECLPESPYGQSKLAAEGYVAYFRRVHRMAAESMRIGNVYGPRQDPLGEAGVIAIFIGALARGDAPTVYGDGRQTRDYVYVGDVVEALLAAEARLSVGGAELRGPYNVGTGVETTVLDLVERLGRLGGRPDITPRMAPPRPGEVQRVALDCSRASAELGWSSRTGLDEGLERTLAAFFGQEWSPARGG
jgi:UDP-glucose 4-epimerase